MRQTPEQKAIRLQEREADQLEQKLITRQWNDFINRMEKKGAIVSGSLTGPARIKIKYSNDQVSIQFKPTAQ
jgi:hypothetical protein